MKQLQITKDKPGYLILAIKSFFTNKGEVSNTKNAINLRLLFAVYYFF